MVLSDRAQFDVALRLRGPEGVAIGEVFARRQVGPESGNQLLVPPVRPIAEHGQVAFDLLIIATLERSGDHLAALVRDGIPAAKLFPLRRDLLPPRMSSESGGNGQPA